MSAEHYIAVTDGADLRFVGELIAHESTQHDRPDRDEWSEFAIYRTHAKAFVAVRRKRVLEMGEPVTLATQARSCASAAEVIEFYTRGQPLKACIKDLLDKAGIVHAQVVP